MKLVFNELKCELKRLGYDVSSLENKNKITIQDLPKDKIEWVKKVRRIKGESFSFEGRPYLEKIYRDENKEIIIVKPRQMEITEFALNWLLYQLIMNPRTVGLYLTDRQDHASIFSKVRLRSWAIEESPILKSFVKKGNVSHLEFNNGSHLFMYSAWTNYERARSIPADFVVVDEVQSTNPEALPVVRETLSKSKFGKILIIGTGSLMGDKWWDLWHKGNQQEWSQEQQQWIAKNPLSKISSYHLSQLMASWIPPEVIEEKRTGGDYTPRRFANEVLGWWYSGLGNPLGEKDITALFNPSLDYVPPQLVDHSKPVYMGVDWGGGTQAFTVVWIWQSVDESIPLFKVLYIAKIEERSTERQADMVSVLIDKYHADLVVIDTGGGARQVEKLTNRYGERVFTCSYIYRPEEPFEIVPHTTRLNVDRTWIIETLIDLITRPYKSSDYPKPIPRIEIPASEKKEVKWLIEHFTSIRAETKETLGKSRVVYTHPPETQDDALHAACYAYLAWKVQRGSRWTGGSL